MDPVTADWQNFFVAEIGASAALAGLVVVAISINLSRILSFPQLPGRAAEALVILIGALVVTSIGLIPGQTTLLLGAEMFVVGAAVFLMPLAIQLRFLKSVESFSPAQKYTRSIVSAAASLPFVAGGTLLMLGSGAGLYWIAAGVILSLVTGVFNAWVLLVEILR